MRLLGSLAVLLFIAPGASAAPLLVNAWVNYFEDVSADSLIFDTSECDFTEFVVVEKGAGFSFLENGPGTTLFDEQARRGYYTSGCGTARYEFTLPHGGVDHIHGRFVANRTVEQFSAVAPVDFVQTVRLEGNSEPLDVFPPASGSQPDTYNFEARGTPAGSTSFIEFSFHDRSFFEETGRPGDITSGVHVEASIRDIQLEHSLIPADLVGVDTTRRNAEGVALQETRVQVRVSAADLREYQVNLQIQMNPNVTFSHVIFPDGGIMRELGTRVSAGPAGYDHGRVLIEDLVSVNVHQATVPREIVDREGPGVYTLVFQEREITQSSSALMPFAIGAMFMPLGAAAFAGAGLRKFRREDAPVFSIAGQGLSRGFIMVMAAYLVAAALIVVGPGVRGMASPVPGVGALLSYAVLIGLTGSFVYLWYLGSKVLLRAARQSTDSARRQALELARSNRDFEEFAHIASHDLQEPLRTIRSYTSMLKRKYRGKLDAQADEFIDYAAGSAKRMSHLIDGLLEYSRVDSAGGVKERVDLDEVVREVRHDLKKSLDAAKAHVLQSRLPVVIGSRAQLHQVILNLMNNAIKFRNPKKPLRINIRAKADGNFVRVDVEDNGRGFKAGTTSRAFDMFYRGDSAPDSGGTGVGLAVVRRVIERHGGTCGLVSTAAQGTRVWFTLPTLDESMK